MRVVIAPESEVTEAVRDCLLSWSRVGLLGPFCLWRVPLANEAAVSDGVERMEEGESRTGSLAEALQGTRSDAVTLVGLYAAGPGQGFDVAFSGAVQRCLDIARDVLAFEKGKPVECTVLVVPEGIGQPVPQDVFCGTWNLYVAPEDRASPPEANQLLSSDGLLARHAAHALATLADLWANAAVQPTGALKAIAGPEAFAIDPPAVRVVRTFTRVIDLGYLSDHIAAGVFKAGKAWPNPDRVRFDRAVQPAHLIATAKREFMALHGELIGLSRFEPLKLAPEQRPTLWQALQELARRIRARIRRLPSDVVDATLGMAHDRIAGIIDRWNGPEEPKVLRWGERPAQERDLVSLVAKLESPLNSADGATAAVWRDLRQLALGLIDGAPLPEGIDSDAYTRADKRMLITDPDAVVPDPELEPPFPAAQRACDPLHLDPRFALPSEGTAAPKEESEAEVERRKQLEEWSARLRPTLLWGVGAEIAVAQEVAREAAEELERNAAAQQVENEEDGDDEEKDAAEESPAEEAETGAKAERSRWRALRNRFAAYSLLAVVASALAWPQLELLPAAGAQVAIIVAWTLAMVGVAVRFVRTEREIERRAILAQFEVVNAATRRALYAGDLPRLERRYAEYLDWAEIIGWMAHHPWVGEPIGRVEVKAPVRQSTLPSAFRVAAGVISPEKIEALCTEARARVFDTGWLNEQYEASLEGAQRRIDLAQAYVGAGGTTDPDADTNEEPDSPRRLLRDAIRRGEGRHLKDNELTEEVLRFMNQLPLGGTATRVSSSLALWSSAEDGSDQLEALPPCPAWFAPPPGMSELAPRILAGVVRISAQTLAGPQVGLGILIDSRVVTSHRVVAGAAIVRVQLPDGSTCEATIAGEMPRSDLALLELEETAVAPEDGCELSDREPQLGEPVLAPSPPQRDPDQPEVALGLVVKGGFSGNGNGASASAGFGATYRTVAGPAGSPVFDLGGRLVGIHRARREEDRESSATIRGIAGVTELKALLDGQSVEVAQEPVVAPGDRSEAPSRFLETLFEADSDSIGLLPQHWVDSDEQHMPDVVLGTDEFGFRSLEELASPAGFLQPVRVIVHRVDVSAALAARELASCATRSDEG